MKLSYMLMFSFLPSATYSILIEIGIKIVSLHLSFSCFTSFFILLFCFLFNLYDPLAIALFLYSALAEML